MRIKSIDNLKGISILGVVFMHLESRLFQEDTNLVVDILQELFGWCVLSFFFASGLVSKRQNDLQSLQHFTFIRIKRLIIPCIVFSISYKIFFLSLDFISSANSTYQKSVDFIAVLDFIFLPAGPQFYFLYYLFFISFFWSLLNVFFSRTQLFYFVIGFSILIFNFIELPLKANGPDINIIPYYTISFAFGAVIQNSYYKLHSYFKELVVFFVLSLSFYLVFRESIFIHILLPPLLWVFFLVNKKISTLLDYIPLGKYSSGIYVWHAPVIMPTVVLILIKIFSDSTWLLIPIVAIVVATSIILTKITLRYKVFKLWRF